MSHQYKIIETPTTKDVQESPEKSVVEVIADNASNISKNKSAQSESSAHDVTLDPKIESHKKKCNDLMQKHNVIPGASWGSLPESFQKLECI